MRSTGSRVVLLLALAVLAAAVVFAAAVRPADAGTRTRSQGPTLVAGISTHYPCGDPVWLRARLRDGAPVKGTRVTFSSARSLWLGESVRLRGSVAPSHPGATVAITEYTKAAPVPSATSGFISAEWCVKAFHART